jgi:RNA polymerase sigma-70 factor (ECF subfamily)
MVSTMLSARIAPTMHGEGPNWVATIRRVAEGDQGALAELYDATSPLVLGLIRRIVEDFLTAEEITLDVYTQVWRLAGTYSQEKGTPMTWLLMLARSRAIDYLRSRARRAKDSERPIEAAWDYSHADRSPETAAISGSRQRIVQEVLADLAPEQLRVLKLAFFDGLSHIEIAEKTGIPLGTIKSRIRAGMMRMRELLEPQVGAL